MVPVVNPIRGKTGGKPGISGFPKIRIFPAVLRKKRAAIFTDSEDRGPLENDSLSDLPRDLERQPVVRFGVDLGGQRAVAVTQSDAGSFDAELLSQLGRPRVP